MKNDNKFYFEITKRIPGKLGRAGIIHTPHGDIKTPAFIAVGTKGHVKFISNEDLKNIYAQAMLSNGYHLRNTSYMLPKIGGLQQKANIRPSRRLFQHIFQRNVGFSLDTAKKRQPSP